MDVGVWAGNTTVATPQYMGEVAEAAERLGFDSLWVSDHVVWPKEYAPVYPYGDDGRYPGDEETPFCEVVTSLAWLSARTTSIRLGTCVLVVAQREPWLLAKQLASVDHLNGGRTVLGVGLGWLREEFEVLGAPFEDRAARTEEAIRLMRTAWTTQPATFAGTYFQAPPVGVLPHPVQQPIPVLVGGNSSGSIRRAAAYGDGWLPFGLGAEEIAAGVATMRRRAAAAGRDPESLRTILWSPLFLDETDTPWVALHGGRDHLVHELQALEKAGVDEFVMFNLAPAGRMTEQLTRLADEVLPAVRG